VVVETVINPDLLAAPSSARRPLAAHGTI